jgi:hypothetical protein
MTGLPRVLQASRPTLTKLRLHGFPLGHDEARQLVMVLRNTLRLQTLILTNITLGTAGLAELAPTLYHRTSIYVPDISRNGLNDWPRLKNFGTFFAATRPLPHLICLIIDLGNLPALLIALRRGWAATQRY